MWEMALDRNQTLKMRRNKIIVFYEKEVKLLRLSLHMKNEEFLIFFMEQTGTKFVQNSSPYQCQLSTGKYRFWAYFFIFSFLLFCSVEVPLLIRGVDSIFLEIDFQHFLVE